MQNRLYKLTGVGLILLLLLAGCKSSQKVGTVAVDGIKEQNEFFNAMMDHSLEYNTLSARLSVDLELPGKQVSSRVDLKIVKDRSLQLSVQPFLGIEMARLEITPDTIKVIDRINKRYAVESYKEIKGQTPIDFNFYNLQALFTNRIFIPGEQSVTPDEYDRFKLWQEGRVAEATIRDAMNILYTFTADGQEKLLSTYITEDPTKYALKWNYTDFRLYGDQTFPMLMDVRVLKNNEPVGGMKISFSRLQTNSALNMDFPLPDKYKRIKFEDIIKSLGTDKQ